jgi:hypothetical protein
MDEREEAGPRKVLARASREGIRPACRERKVS